MRICIALFFLFTALVFSASAQMNAKGNTPACKAGTLAFKCPEYFKRLPDLDATTSLFKYYKDEVPLYFFVGAPSKDFDFSSVQKSVGKYFSKATFRWKGVDEIFMMSMKTKYDKKLRGSLGFDGENLLTLTSATFVVKGKPVVLGYIFDSDIMDPGERFDKGNSLGDNASGCNAIVDTLNSITNEFPGEKQYCFLTGFSGSN